MSNLRKTVISNCEKQFLLKNLSEWTRLDGRSFDEFREVKIEFGKDWGCCYASLGKTRVIAQVTCELQQPKSSRPSEGILNINFELNPMADPNFEAGRPSEYSAQLNRLLEKCIKDSKAVDLESLCVKMNERVWSFRVDINLLNHEGNVLDCASIAALAALAHFRRPDVTCDGEELQIHSYKQRDPIPTVIHHYPVCVTFGIFSEGDFILADPNLLEEGVSEAFLSIGLNAYKELCGLHLGGKALLTPHVILETTNKASKRAGEMVKLIKESVEKDIQERQKVKDSGFNQTLNVEDIDVPLADLSICLDQWSTKKGKKKKKKSRQLEIDLESSRIEEKNEMETDDTNENNLEDSQERVKDLGDCTAELINEKKEAGWNIVKSDEESENDDVLYVDTPSSKVEIVDIADSNSEEEKVVVLNSDKKKNKKKKKVKT